ncbi:hypothetical protein D3C73_631410 [compost metagenome]
MQDPYWYPVSGIGRCRLQPRKKDRRVQRHGYKGVISQPVTGEAFSLNFSLWTVREGNHVFDQCLICMNCIILHNVRKSQENDYYFALILLSTISLDSGKHLTFMNPIRQPLMVSSFIVMAFRRFVFSSIAVQ